MPFERTALGAPELMSEPAVSTPPASMLLSAFHLAAPERIPQLAVALEQSGYTRYWMAEHRTGLGNPNPTLCAAVAASYTNRLRVGTAGVKLRYASPRQVSDDFELLNRMFPGRIDLGTIAGREQDEQLHAELLDGRPDTRESYDARLARVLELVAEASRTNCAAGGAYPRPSSTGRPQPWVCSLHLSGALAAAEHGAGLAYHLYLARQFDKSDGPALAAAYRAHFQRSAQFAAPAVVLVLYGCCATEPGAAARLWRRQFGLAPDDRVVVGAPRTGPDFLGTPEECVAQLQSLATTWGPVEFALHCVNADATCQMRQYELLARAAGLRAPAVYGQ